MINLPDEIVRNTPAFTRLKAEVAHATLELERVRALLETTSKEADELRERQEEFRTKIVVSRVTLIYPRDTDTHIFFFVTAG
jgi:hypothetical protein